MEKVEISGADATILEEKTKAQQLLEKFPEIFS
jgi:hypothetical protein